MSFEHEQPSHMHLRSKNKKGTLVSKLNIKKWLPETQEKMCSWLSNCSWTQESGLFFHSHTKLLSTGPRVLVNWCSFKWLFSRPAASCCFLGSTWGWLRWTGWSNTTKGVSLNMCCAMQFWCNFFKVNLRLRQPKKCSAAGGALF